jgi:putative ABC transport system permease protein
MGIRLVSGRDFDERDDRNAPSAAIINESLARLHFPGEDPLGKRLSLGMLMGDWQSPMLEVIGVVGDVKHRHLGADVRPEIYTPHAQGPFPESFIVVKTRTDARNHVAALRAEVQALDANLPIYDLMTLDERLGQSVARERFNTLLIAGFAALALVLATIGLYGVISYGVTQRTQEIGIRMALGASSRVILGMVIRQGAKLALAGIIPGLMASSLLARLTTSMLYGVGPTDVLTYLAVTLLFVAAALGACYIPARRATRVDPILALRE